MTEHVLVVGGDRDLSSVIRAVAPDVATTVLCRLEFLPKLRNFHKHTRLVALRPDSPDQEWVAIASAIHQQHPFTRIATFEDRDQGRCAQIGKALNLSTHAPETVAAANDKQKMRELLCAAGVDNTASAVITDVDALLRFVGEHGLPCIVKPQAGEGSAGVSLLWTEESAGRAFKRAQRASRGRDTPGVLVEVFHQGPQYSVEAFSENGEHAMLGIVKKFWDPTSFVELGHVTPADLPPQERDVIHEFIKTVLTAVGVQSGPTHTEIVMSAEGPKVIETHLRMGGDDRPALMRDTTGVDMAEFLVRQTLGSAVLPEIRQRLTEPGPYGGAAIWFATSPVDGTLAGVDGLTQVSKIEGVVEASQIVRDGDRCRRPLSSDDRLAYARSVADDPGAALKVAQSAIDQLVFRLDVHTSAVGSV